MSRHLPIFRLRRFGSDASGATAVEFAMLCPLYLFLFMGMTAYGIYFGASHSVQQLSADSARAAVAGVTAAERRTLALDFIQRNGGRYVFIDPDRLTVDVADSTGDANQFNVTVSYDASDLPIWSLFDGLSMPGQTILRRSTVRIGGI